MNEPLHILILTARDWTHPRGGEAAADLFAQVSSWLDSGHRVSVIAASYEGAEPVERAGALTLHRMGGATTVVPRAIRKQRRGLVPDADVVLEVVDGTTFLAPLWSKTPRITLVHREHEEQAKGRVAGFLTGTLPLRLVYRDARILTTSGESAEHIAGLGIPREQIEVASTSADDRAAETLGLLREERAETGARPSVVRGLMRTDTGRAAGLAGALIANSFIALIVVIGFARLLDTSGYGSLVTLLGVFAVLMVPGSALQATVAREVSAEAAGGAAHPGAGVRGWLRRLAAASVALSLVSVILREEIASAIGVDSVWAAASVIPTGCLWLLLCVQRGALQGLRHYAAVGLSIVGEAAARLVLGVGLVVAGLGVPGAFLGTTLSIVAMVLAVSWPLHRALREGEHAAGAEIEEPGLRHLLGRAGVPVLAFSLIAALQNIDLVYVQREMSGDAAGAYGAASVAAKAMIWVAIGLGLYLLPEAVRRTKNGQDARPVLLRTLALIGIVAVPMIILYTVAPAAILTTVFGDEKYAAAAGALPLLALAMSLLACAYLSVQYLLALGRVSFVALLGVAAGLELVLLAIVGAELTSVALVLALLQLALAPAVLAFVMHSAARAARAAAAGREALA